MLMMLATREQRDYYQTSSSLERGRMEAAVRVVAAVWQGEVAAQLVAENGVRVPLVVLVASGEALAVREVGVQKEAAV